MMTHKRCLLSFGELLWDCFQEQAHIGGAPFNLAAHAVRCGLSAHLISRVGADELGRRALRAAHRLGVGTECVQEDAQQPTGTVTVQLSPAGQPTYTIHAPVAWDFIATDEALLSVLRGCRWAAICFGSLAQRNAVARTSLWRVLETFPAVPAFFDVNLRQSFFSSEVIAQSLQRTTILKLNEDEVAILAQLLFGTPLNAADFARKVIEQFFVQIVLVTRGARGCLLIERTGQTTEIPGQPVKVADAVGAGDAFSAAFLAFWLRGRVPAEAARLANAVGAFVASQHGAVPAYSAGICLQLGLEGKSRP
jgi:fructokinase